MSHRSVWLGLLACGLAAAPADGAAARTLSVRSPAITANLGLTAQFTPRRTTVRVRGRARVRQRGVALVLLRCADARCVRYGRRGRALRRLRRGQRRLALRLRVGPSPFARVELRAGRRVLAKATLRRPTVARPPSVPAPPEAAAPPAGAGSVSSSPPLVPAYDPAVPDYTVACEPARTVQVVATGGTVAIDGAPPASGRAERTLALSAGQAFVFSVDGRSHSARCLPRNWTGWTVTRDGTPEVEWIVFNTFAGADGYTVIADARGVPVWWRVGPAPLQDGHVLPDGTVVVGRVTEGSWGRQPYERVALDGSSRGELDTVGTSADPHELALLPNGNALMMRYLRRDEVDLSSLGGPADATVIDGEIQEVTPEHELVWSWNSADHIGTDETTFPLAQIKARIEGVEAYDLVHLNSLQQDGDGILLSARNLNAVYRIRRGGGGVDWKLGGTPRAESLGFRAGPFGAADLGGQHQARRLPDGTITLHDNGTGKGRPPRALRFALDPLARAATVIERVADPRVASSICCGGATRLAGGHWLMSWGYAPTITELTASGRPVLTLTLDRAFSYRAQSVPSTLLSREALRAGMDAMHPR
jgi:hypothetical protein